jgi:integrase
MPNLDTIRTILPDLGRMEDFDMARRRRQSKGELTESGGFWRLRWREDRINSSGTLEYGWSPRIVIGPSDGPGRLNRRQAEKIAWDNFLSRVNATNTPSTVMTVAQFVERKFLPEHVSMLKKAGQVHYASQLQIVLDGGPKNLKACIGKLKLRDVTPDRVQMLVSEAIRAGYSVQSARHIANTVSAIFTHAERIRWHQQANPARYVRFPEMERKQTHSLTVEQFALLRSKLPEAVANMVTVATLTGLRIGELLALRWSRINLTGEDRIQDGVRIPALSLLVAEQFHRAQFQTIKGHKKQRVIPISKVVLETLAALNSGSGDGLVFANSNGDRPVDAKNIFNRILKPFGRSNGMPWLNWHTLRHTFSTWTDGAGISPEQRRILLGHASIRTTSEYAHPQAEAARAALDSLVQ